VDGKKQDYLQCRKSRLNSEQHPSSRPSKFKMFDCTNVNAKFIAEHGQHGKFNSQYFSNTLATTFGDKKNCQNSIANNSIKSIKKVKITAT